MRRVFGVVQAWVEGIFHLAGVVRWGGRWLIAGEMMDEGRVSIFGEHDFVLRSRDAIGLLRQHAPDAYELLQRHIRFIVQGGRGVALPRMVVVKPDSARTIPELAGMLAYFSFCAQGAHHRGGTFAGRNAQEDLDAAAFTRSVMSRLNGA